MNNSPFRRIALDLPDAVEKDHFGAPSFRVRDKIFAQLSADGETGLIKLSLDRQAWVIATQPKAFTVEPSWGRHGWTRLTWRLIAPDLLADLIGESWRAVAPRDLKAAHPVKPA